MSPDANQKPQDSSGFSRPGLHPEAYRQVVAGPPGDFSDSAQTRLVDTVNTSAVLTSSAPSLPKSLPSTASETSAPGTSVLQEASGGLADENSALLNGVWQTDGSRHTAGRRLTEEERKRGHLLVQPQEGRSTLKMCYLFSGTKRRSSIANELAKLCKQAGLGLHVWEVDILNGGSDMDLLDEECQQYWMSRVESGYFDIIILSPPCGSWSRANYSNRPGPKPVRSRAHPWGLPGLQRSQQKRCTNGNTFIHFSIRAILAAQDCKRRGRWVSTLWEHPEDLGLTSKGVPASVWQLKIVRTAYKESVYLTCAGYQCQFPEVDRAKPTRIYTDILSLKVFGYRGWPSFTRDFRYLGPLPRSCGHHHEEQMIGELPGGGWATSHSAMYPGGMCEMFALHIFNDFMSRETRPFGRGKPAVVQPPSLPKHDLEPSSSSQQSLPNSLNPLPVRHDLMHIRADDIRVKNSIISQDEVDRAT